MNISILVSIATILFGTLGHSQSFTATQPNLTTLDQTANSVEIGTTYQLTNDHNESILLENKLPQKTPMFLNCDTIENMSKFPIDGQTNSYFTFDGKDLLIVNGKTRRIKEAFENTPLSTKVTAGEHEEFFNGIGDFAHIITSQDDPNTLLAAIYTCKFNDIGGLYSMPLTKLLRIDLNNNTVTTLNGGTALRNDDGIGTFEFVYESKSNMIQLVPAINTNLKPEKLVSYTYPMLEESIHLPAPANSLVYPINCERSIDISVSPLVYCYEQYQSDIVAIMDGKVVETGNLSDHPWGKYIIVDHGNALQSIYTNLTSISVQKGNVVKAGKKIASVKTNPSLDAMFSFAMTFRGYYFNPLERLVFDES